MLLAETERLKERLTMMNKENFEVSRRVYGNWIAWRFSI